MVINKKEKYRKSNQHKIFQEIRMAQNPPRNPCGCFSRKSAWLILPQESSASIYQAGSWLFAEWDRDGSRLFAEIGSRLLPRQLPTHLGYVPIQKPRLRYCLRWHCQPSEVPTRIVLHQEICQWSLSSFLVFSLDGSWQLRRSFATSISESLLFGNIYFLRCFFQHLSLDNFLLYLGCLW
jgi:hypothetical protein